MSRRLACLIALLAGAALVVAPAQQAVAAGCSSSQVTVVVDYQGSTRTGCASHPSSGLDALSKAGFSVRLVTGEPFVCQIGGEPKADPCNHTPPQSAYWAYFHAHNGKWSYASAGAGSYRPPAGSIDGWSFGAGHPPGTPPPASAPAPTTTPTQKPKPTHKPSPTHAPPVSATASPTAPATHTSTAATPTTMPTKAPAKKKHQHPGGPTMTPLAGSVVATPTPSPSATSSPRPAASDAATDGHGISWVWGVLLVVVLGGAGGGIALLRRRA